MWFCLPDVSLFYANLGVSSESEGTNQKFIEGEIGLTGPWQQQGAQHNSEQSSQEANIIFHKISHSSSPSTSPIQQIPKGGSQFLDSGLSVSKTAFGQDRERKYMGHVGWFPAKFIK